MECPELPVPNAVQSTEGTNPQIQAIPVSVPWGEEERCHPPALSSHFRGSNCGEYRPPDFADRTHFYSVEQCEQSRPPANVFLRLTTNLCSSIGAQNDQEVMAESAPFPPPEEIKS